MVDPKKMGRIVRILFPFVVACGIIILLIGAFNFPPILLTAKPEKSAQVEVVGKRFEEDWYHSKLGASKIHTYFISFKFPDGSVKELVVGSSSKRIESKKELRNSAYDSINEGDIGILTYKELENFDGKYSLISLRRFISFEKDASAELED